jgi:D-serine dehydratase
LVLARSIKTAEPYLALRGVEGFEGLVAGTTVEKETVVARFLKFLVETATTVAREGLFAPGPLILSAGGSASMTWWSRLSEMPVSIVSSWS